MNRRSALFSLLVLGAAAVLGGCSRQPSPAAASPEVVRSLSLITAQEANTPDVLEVSGTVRAAQTSVLSSQMMGTVVSIHVREGDRVRQGQVLAVIDDSQPRAAMERAEAASHAAQQSLAGAESDLALADATLKRYQALYERKSVSPQEFDEIKARYQAAEARRDMARADVEQANSALAQARTAFDYSRLRAPFEGVVTEKKVDTGALASPGMALFTVEDVRRFHLEATVNETDLAHVRMGQPVPVQMDALGDANFQGRVAQIVPAADPASRSFLVKIDLPVDSRLRSGLFGRAQFSRGEHRSLLIPRTAIIQRGQLQGVFVLDQKSVAGLRYVTLGRTAGANVEVLAGLQNGEQLVANPGGQELDGKRVEVVR
jgi:RND family efflux transporter MFP subunit